jgi:hypothetical protein
MAGYAPISASDLLNVGGGANPPYRQAQMKKPGAVSRPGTIREFQFHE